MLCLVVSASFILSADLHWSLPNFTQILISAVKKVQVCQRNIILICINFDHDSGKLCKQQGVFRPLEIWSCLLHHHNISPRPQYIWNISRKCKFIHNSFSNMDKLKQHENILIMISMQEIPTFLFQNLHLEYFIEHFIVSEIYNLKCLGKNLQIN